MATNSQKATDPIYRYDTEKSECRKCGHDTLIPQKGRVKCAMCKHRQ